MTALFGVALVILITVFGVGMYFLPTMIAADRRPPNFASVVVINAFLGWTFVGWVVALAMAFRDPKPPGAAREPPS